LMSEVSTEEPTSEDLEPLIRSPSSRNALLAPNWLDKVSKKEAEGYIVDRILDNLSQIISNYSNNLIQLTIEQNHLTDEKISQRPEYKEAIENQKRVFTVEIQGKLPTFYPWVEFRTRFYGIIVGRLRFKYKIEPEITAKNVTITLLNNHPRVGSIGCVEASFELSMLVNAIWVKLGKINRKINLDKMSGLHEWTHASKPARRGLAEAAETKFCVECGAEIPASAKFCRYCGTNQDLMAIHA